MSPIRNIPYGLDPLPCTMCPMGGDLPTTLLRGELTGRSLDPRITMTRGWCISESRARRMTTRLGAARGPRVVGPPRSPGRPSPNHLPSPILIHSRPLTAPAEQWNPIFSKCSHAPMEHENFQKLTYKCLPLFATP